MKTSVNFYDFKQAFRIMGREGQFSPEGLAGLFDYLQQYEDDTGEELELDVIALCCDFTELEWREVASEYNIDISDCVDNDEVQEKVSDYLCYNTMVAWSNDESVIYAAF